MSYTYLLAVGEESSAEYFSDIPQSVLSRLSLTAGKSCSSGSETESCRDSQSGTTCGPSMPDLGWAWWMLYAAGSHARESVQPEATAPPTENLSASMGQALSFGGRFRESLLNAGIQTCLLKTPRALFPGDCVESFQNWTPLGMWGNGAFWGLATSAPTMKESAFGYRLPTPTAHNSKEGAYPAEYTRNTPTLAAQIGGKINPDWNEWRMGWPIRWTDLKPLEMGSFHKWLHLHGGPCAETHEIDLFE